MKEFLCPALKRGQIVLMDDLSVHKAGWVRESIEERGCTLVHLPAYYSPDFNPIEQASSQVKALLRKAKARTREALFEATHHALGALAVEDACGFFGHCGYTSSRAHSI